MAKPRKIGTIYIKTPLDKSRSGRYIELFQGTVKAGEKYSFEVVPPLGGTSDGDALATEIFNLVGVKEANYKNNKIELFLENNSKWLSTFTHLASTINDKLHNVFENVFLFPLGLH
jgi:hypothetical protein